MRVEVERLIKQGERDLENARKTLAELRPWFAYLNPDYTTARYPDAANGVPYEVYDRVTAESKIGAVEKVFPWLRQLTGTKK